MDGQHVCGGRGEASDHLRIQRDGDGRGETRLIMDAEAAARGDQTAGERFEVFHVWPDDQRLAREDGFRGILAAGGEEAFADDHDIRMGGPIAELAGGIDD